jgi:diguanylate cyclase (GGDEF)-like protein/PAS domain S-box-containing protein
MKRNNANDDMEVLQRLRAQAERLSSLETRIAELEHERNSLLDSSGRMNTTLEQYKQIKDEWEWFFDNSLDFLCIAGLDGYYKRVNRAFAATLGYTESELLARPFTDLIHPDDIERTRLVLQNLGAGEDCVFFENRYRAHDGTWHWLAWRCPSTTPTVPLIYAIARDVTEHKRTEAEILHLAMHDALTGLPNRAAFELELDQAISRTARDPAKQIALFAIDLDGFKTVNDTYGHAAGDQLLKIVAARFMSIQRSGDHVARMGGDEFAWLTEGFAPMETKPLAKRLIEAVQLPFVLEAATVAISCSIGISTFPYPADNVKKLTAQADVAMYKAKKSGKNQYCCFTL